jgi:hypothetical protein
MCCYLNTISAAGRQPIHNQPGQMAVVDGENITLKRFCEYPQQVKDSGLHEDAPEALA